VESDDAGGGDVTIEKYRGFCKKSLQLWGVYTMRLIDLFE
jgi:hypothetical protein